MSKTVVFVLGVIVGAVVVPKVFVLLGSARG